MPLRIRLVAALLALVTAALAIAGFTAATLLRRYLVERVDTQLVQAARPFANDGGPGPGPGGGPGPGRDGRFRQREWVRVVDANGTVTDFRSSTTSVPDLPAEVRSSRMTVGSSDGERWRVVAVRRDSGGYVLAARPLTDETSTVQRLVLVEVVAGAAVLALLGALGYLVVRRSLRPLVEVEETAEAIAAGDLSRRVPAGDPRTEVGRLSGALNAMLHQIENAFRAREESERRMRRFLADASHELRTPLTSIRGFAELYRQGAAGPDDVPRLMRRIEDEGARMGLLVDDLLLLARLDEERPLAREPVDLVRIAADAVHDARAVDPEREVRLDAGEGAYEVAGDEPRLRQVVGNLVGNALRHTPAGTPVEVRLRVDGAYVVVEVVDHGPGLPPEDAARVFERFFRADAARTRAEGGAGLGLAIAAAVTRAHGGAVAVRETAGGGATFEVRLPLAR